MLVTSDVSVGSNGVGGGRAEPTTRMVEGEEGERVRVELPYRPPLRPHYRAGRGNSSSSGTGVDGTSTTTAPPARPENVGILAMNLYIPPHYVDQHDLERFDGVSEGKYTNGLGQNKMAFTEDVEDVNSLCLTVVRGLLKRCGVKKWEVGRLEVGTETLVDKSKSVKSWVMQLFENLDDDDEGDGREDGVGWDVGDVEGVDSTNACYGGTAALLNSLHWIESSHWDGRYALVLAADIATYAPGPARPTGGSGAIALLLGPNASLVFERGRATYMQHVYDFYKPDMRSEFPVVDGKVSVGCYFESVDRCYERFKQRWGLREEGEDGSEDGGRGKGLERVDYVVFHSPFARLVQKSFARLAFNDDHPPTSPTRPAWTKSTETQYLKLTESQFLAKTEPTLWVARECGNMYCASLYAGLVSLVYNVGEGLRGKRILLFSYGSGSASTMFSLLANPHSLTPLLHSLPPLTTLLNTRTRTPPDEYTHLMAVREKMYRDPSVPFVPSGRVERLRKGTFYLRMVDERWRRWYAVKE